MLAGAAVPSYQRRPFGPFAAGAAGFVHVHAGLSGVDHPPAIGANDCWLFRLSTANVTASRHKPGSRPVRQRFFRSAIPPEFFSRVYEMRRGPNNDHSEGTLRARGSAAGYD